MAEFIDRYLDVLQNIEFGLKEEYENNKNLNDVKLIFALENAIIAIKKEFGYARNDKIVEDNDTNGVIYHCVQVGLERINNIKDISLKDYVKCIERVKKSVMRHSQSGRRGYYDFIKNYV
ncbi:hypothetical protein JEZ13_09115 [bacterium]|nr:hypothetical protein [bacterium]